MNTNPINTLFVMASQFKFRFPYKGMITTEDLWDLSLSQLDTVYRNLNKEVKDTDSDSLMRNISADEAVKVNELKNKIEIVKYIFNSKEHAAELNRMANERSAKRQQILEILDRKREDALANMSEDELKAMLGELS